MDFFLIAKFLASANTLCTPSTYLVGTLFEIKDRLEVLLCRVSGKKISRVKREIMPTLVLVGTYSIHPLR